MHYETVIGLEVHAQLATKSKLFCADSTAFGAEPNSQVSVISLAHPGTLPRLNRRAVEYAVRMGLAIGSEITRVNYFSRKNYFYPDLPKGYQVTQHSTPICVGGSISINVNGNERAIRVHHIHLEEDAGKSLHDADDSFTSIDLNRAGTPLIEIVTEPDLRSGEEAYQLLYEVRKLVRYLGICDGNMEEGSLRCDANISVRKAGDTKLGTKVEIKNLNSMRFVREAIRCEAERMVALLEAGSEVVQETRSFSEKTGTTIASREKEDAHDYRYFPEPDIPPFELTDDYVTRIRELLPVLPAQRRLKYLQSFRLSPQEAGLLSEEREFSDYFERLAEHSENTRAAANWMLGPVRAWMNEEQKDISQLPLSAEKLAALVRLVNTGKVSFSVASGRLWKMLVADPEADPDTLAREKQLVKNSDSAALDTVIDEVLQKFAGKVGEYRKGKKGLLGLFVGEVMKRTGGRADPELANQILLKKLNEQ